MSCTPCSPRDVLALVAAGLTHDAAAIPELLGSITLREDQRAAASRLLDLLNERRGALLADPVGSGKTYTALAVARAVGPTAIVTPAVLRDMWREAADRAGVSQVMVVSMEAMGRRDWRPPPVTRSARLLIVDEAHHARNPRSQRFRALAALCAERLTLLLSATPVHNTSRDMRSLLSLFLGSAAERADPGDYIVRRPAAADDSRPVALRCGTLRIAHDADTLQELLALPPPLGEELDSIASGAHALATTGLLRAWASSDGALRSALRRRLTRAMAISAMLESGQLPDRASLARWMVDDGVIQLGLPGLDATCERQIDRLSASRYLEVIYRHLHALRSLLKRMETDRHGEPDVARAAHLVRLLHDWRARIVAFSHSAETVRTLFREMRREAGVALLTGSGARVAGGALSRREVLARFAPRAQGARRVGPAEEVRLLLTTDLLAEGVNLQDANVIVHLDMPWTAARLAQREGRVVRRGSVHSEVRVYRMGAPVAARRMLAIERRLQAKARSAREALGLSVSLDDDGQAGDETRASQRERILHALRDFRGAVLPDGALEGDGGTRVASVATRRRGALALVRTNGLCRLVAINDRGIVSDSPGRVGRLLEAAVRAVTGGEGAVGWGGDRTTPGDETEPVRFAPLASRSGSAVLRAAERWLCEQRAGAAVGLPAGRSRGRVSRRLAQVTRELVVTAEHHQRASWAALLARINELASRPLPVATEEEILRLLALKTSLDPADWLARAAHLADLAPPDRSPKHSTPPSDSVIAILLLGDHPAAD
jgi:superfamily II DNA or RNA helicase